eukprot:CAMPEP_0116064074 /NCGR_PEP_ID=MMETSP0322-20121206/8861_1 /TAXON_ID=163516 /ORGANISM="Leptocylindrus danicus var. apora, Strain B651" /LENGTH=70 /DNA_ID=CAMNT_0003549949 /DNA_START=258 /DNA_END=465 /DNA_ORIENTATION=+
MILGDHVQPTARQAPPPSHVSQLSILQVRADGSVGLAVGLSVGLSVGLAVGLTVGLSVGLAVGLSVGLAV